jgi:hypothetical protein
MMEVVWFLTTPRTSSQTKNVGKKAGNPLCEFFKKKTTIGCETAHEDDLLWVLFLSYILYHFFLKKG